MGVRNDGYGKTMYAHLKDPGVPEVIERDDGYIDVGTEFVSVYFSPFRDWPGIEKKASRFIRGRVLDIGCGAGRVELYLQGRGHKVTGIDNSPLAVKVCRLRGVKDARVMSIGELHRFKPRSFDTIVMFGNNFGLFGNYRRAKRLLREMHRITSDDAVIIGDTIDPYRTHNPVHLAYHRLNRKRGRMPGHLRLRIRFKNCIGGWFDYLFVSKAEMREILKGTGWRARKFISKKQNYAAIIEKC